MSKSVKRCQTPAGPLPRRTDMKLLSGPRTVLLQAYKEDQRGSKRIEAAKRIDLSELDRSRPTKSHTKRSKCEQDLSLQIVFFCTKLHKI